MVNIKDGASYAPTAKVRPVVAAGEFQFAAAFLDHGHIYGQCNGLCDAGATLKWVFDPDPARVEKFLQVFPGVRIATSFEEILSDPELRLITAAAIPNQRAGIGAQVLDAGKDYLTDKSPFTSLQQLEDIRDKVESTACKYMVYYAERLHNDAAWRAGELIEQGAIGQVIQVLNLAPHRLARASRPDWFFDKSCCGGILTDIGCHQVEQFLTYANCSNATVNFARVDNVANPDKPGFEDFGEISLTGDNGTSFYTRVDWFTPEGLRTWGDGRTFILGTTGTMELRKYIDLARDAPASRLFLVDGDGEQEIDCQGMTGFPFFGKLILDCIHRTETAMTQAHAFKAAELSMRAQLIADNL